MTLLLAIFGAWVGLGFVLAVLLGRGIAADPETSAPAHAPMSPERERVEPAKRAA